MEEAGKWCVYRKQASRKKGQTAKTACPSLIKYVSGKKIVCCHSTAPSASSSTSIATLLMVNQAKYLPRSSGASRLICL